MKIIKFLTVLFIFFLINTSKSFSLIEVDITRGNLNPLPIAVSPLSQNDKSKKISQNKLNLEDLGLEIAKVVENNLKNSGLFNPLNKDAFLQRPDIADRAQVESNASIKLRTRDRERKLINKTI